MAEETYPHDELLVNAAWLAGHLNDANLKVLDARSAADYAAGHIPGALLLPNGVFRATGGVPDTCSAEEFAATAGALGVRPEDTVACVDSAGPAGARAWWAFARFGHGDARFLNGGYRRWQAGGHPLSTEPVEPSPVVYQLREVQDHLACSLAEAEQRVKDGNVLFWDVRTAGEFSGADPRSNPPDRAGHIPRAVHLEWTELVDAATGLLKPAAEMRRILAAKGITPESRVVAY